MANAWGNTYFIQSATPTATGDERVSVGMGWSDIGGSPAWKRCTSVSPITFVSTEGGSAVHDILSATHSDALAAAVVRGDVIIGNSTPKWARLAIGAANSLLKSDGTDVAWSRALNITQLIVNEDMHWEGIISPAQIAADQNNYNPTGLATANVMRLSTDAARNLTGLTAPAASREQVILLHNVGSFNLVLKDESASSSAANRFALNADITLGADQAVLLWYDSVSTRWRALSGVGGGGGSNHAILDASVHTDSAAQGVSRGSLIVGNSTPAWDELVIGTVGKVLYSDGADPSWKDVEPMARGQDGATETFKGWFGSPRGGAGTLSLAADNDYYEPMIITGPITLTTIALEVTTAAAAGKVIRLGIYLADDDWQPSGNPVVDGGTVAVDSTGVKTVAISTALAPGNYLLVANSDGTPIVRFWRQGSLAGMRSALGASAWPDRLRVARTHAAFPSPGTKWNNYGTDSTGQNCFMAVTW